MENTSIELPKDQSAFSSLHQITPLSKYLALTLFISLPFVGGYIGYLYAPVKIIEVSRVMPERVQYTEDEQLDTTDNNIIDSNSELGSENIPTLRLGDSVGAFTLEFTSPVFMITTGTTTVSGNFIMDGSLEGEVCFNVTPTDAWKIPRIGDDNRSPWFCFRNEVPKSVIQKEDSITIEIANYEVDSRPIGTTDSAEFVRLIE